MMSRLHPFGRSFVCLTLALAPCPAVAAPLGRPALYQPSGPSDDDQAKARVAYEKGESAYRVGNFEAAAVAFEHAYELSGLPDILYNIGLAHLRWYDVDLDATHLRKAKAVFQNYLIELQNDPELGDLDQAERLIAGIDEKLAAVPAAGPNTGDGEPEPPPVDPDAGKQLRLGGGISMGIGGAFVVGAVASAVAFSVSGQATEDSIISAADSLDQAGCAPDSTDPECVRINERIDELQAKGRTANALAIGLGASFGVVGVAGIIVGAVLFTKGKKQQRAGLSVAPSWSPGGGGLSVSGRF